MIKRLLLTVMMSVLMSIGLTSCFIEDASAQVPVQYGCVIQIDAFGEREICNAHYYTTVNNVAIVFDPYYHTWVGPNYYWHIGYGWRVGLLPGYHARYGQFYRPYGYHVGYSKGYYNYRGYGGYRGGGGFRGRR